MDKLEKVIKGFEKCLDPKSNCYHNEIGCPYENQCWLSDSLPARPLKEDALELLRAQKDRHRLEVHNIGNVDIPEGVSAEHFHLVMNNVVDALQHTDKGESWPYHNVT